MKFLVFDQNAISQYVSITTLQSIEYMQSNRLIQHVRGELESEVFVNTVVEYTKEGIIFFGKKSEDNSIIAEKREYKIFCIDLTTCDLLSEQNANVILTVLQKSFRTVLKIWNRQPFTSSERIHGTKSIVFPFIFPDRRRIVIERSNILRIEKRGINFPLLAYKYNAEDPPQREEVVDTRVLKLAGEIYVSKYPELQRKLKDSLDSSQAIQDAHAFEQVKATVSVERDDFIYWTYEQQYKNLTETQKFVVDYAELTSPLRVDGAAGTGKTMSLIMRAYKLLNMHKSENKPFHIIFFAHSRSTSQRNEEMFKLYPDGDIFLQQDSPQNIRFTTLLEYCAEFAKISLNALIDVDAGDAKSYQLMLIENVVNKAKENCKIRTYRPLISSDLKLVFDSEKTASNVLYSMLQHEFSVQIKGRTDGTIDTYYEISSIPNGLPCVGKKDKEFIFSLFCDYQEELQTVGSFDVDDVTMEALSHLNAPVWRRQRSAQGYDYIFADEMHLFNINEQSIFHYLTKNLSQKNVPICFALDYSQAIGDRGDVKADYIEKAFGTTVSQKYCTVFRNAPQIAEFCASIAASGTLMFQENFSNPYIETQSSFTQEEEQKSVKPILHMYSDDKSMIESINEHIEKIMRELQCKPNDIAVISFENSLVSKEGEEQLEKIFEKQFVLLDSTQRISTKDYVLASPYAINGLEFKGVVLVGVDEGRVPQTMGTGDISKHFIKYSAYNLLYLASSRAKYRLIILGNKLKGRSSCLEYSISSERVDVIEH